MGLMGLMGRMGLLGDEIGQGSSWVWGLHEILADEEAAEASLAKSLHGVWVRDAALTDEGWR